MRIYVLELTYPDGTVKMSLFTKRRKAKAKAKSLGFTECVIQSYTLCNPVLEE